MKALKKFKRLAASLMTMFLLTGEFYGTGFAALAADDAEDDVIVAEEEVSADDTEAAVEEETAEEEPAADGEMAEEDEEVPEEGDYGPGIELLKVMVNGTNVAGNAGKYYGTNGVVYDSIAAMPSTVKGYLMYQSGVLTLKDYTIDGNKPLTSSFFISGREPINNIETNSTSTLTIRVIGDCAIKPAGRSGETCYAIKCPGDLIIENTLKISTGFITSERGVPGTLTIKSTPADGVYWGGSIKCGGSLYIQNQKATSFSLNSYDGLTLDIDMSGSKKAAASYASEIWAGENVSINKAQINSRNGDNGSANCGIVAENGTVDMVGGTYVFTCGQPAASSITQGIVADGNISISNYADVSLNCEVGGDYKGYGIRSVKGKISIDKSHVCASVDSKNGNAAVYAGGGGTAINLKDCYIETPIGGKVGTVTVVDKDGKDANFVEIVSGEQYDLWIGQYRVNSNDCDDLRSCFEGPSSRTASFDPATGTLSLSGVTNTDGYYEYNPYGYEKAKIYSEIPLKIIGDGKIIGSGSNYYGIVISPDAAGESVIEGQFEINGTEGAILTNTNCSLKIDGAATTLKAVSSGGNAIEAKGGFILEDGSVVAEGKGTGVRTSEKPIELKQGSLSAKGSSYAVLAYKSTVDLGENMEITTPAGGAAGTIDFEIGNGGVILNGDAAAKETVIVSTAKSLSVMQADGVYGTELSNPTMLLVGLPDGFSQTNTYKGTVDDGSSYGPTTDKPEVPGKYKVTVELTKGTDVWRGSADFVIKPFELTVKADAEDRVYEEGNKTVQLKDAGFNETIIEGDAVTADLSSAVAEMADDAAGENKAVTVTGVKLAGVDDWRYSLKEQPSGITVNISKAVWTATSASGVLEAGQNGSLSLAGYIAPGAAASVDEESLISGDEYLDMMNLSGDTLVWKIKDGATKAEVKLSVHVKGATNYQDYDISVTLKVQEFVVSFEMNGHGEQIQNTKVCKSELLEEPAKPVEKGFVFKGWFTDEALTTAYDFSKPVTADFTLYAKWEEADAGVSPLDPKPYIDGDTTQLYLVAGQKFNIGSGWTVSDKNSKKIVSISKKGAFKAKKAGDAVITNGTQTISVNVCKPVIEKTFKINTGDPAKAISLTGYGDLDVLWYSAAPDIAEVDPYTGAVTAVAKGNAKITAYINGCAFKCTVKVTEPTPALNRSLHIAKDSSKSISIKGLKKPNWQANVDGIVDIKNNKITGKAAGAATLKAVGNDPEYLVYVFVEDLTITGAAAGKGANKYKLELTSGSKTQIEYAGIYQNVVFKSSKPDTAFIDEDGKIYARSAGKAKFTAKVDGKTITIDVVVK